jgi:hypothetical protein
MFEKKKHSENPAQNAITGNFNLTAQLAGASGRSIAIAGYIYDGESKQSLEERIDVLQEIIERQRLRCEIPELEAKREQMIKGLGQAKDIMLELEDKQKSGDLSSQERLNLRNIRTNIAKVNEEITKGTEAIADAKKKAGVG